MRSERIKNKRKVMLEARLAKVKQRRKLKGGTLLGLEDNGELELTYIYICSSVFYLL